MHQYKMRGVRPDRLLGGDSLPTLQVGPEVHRSGQRGRNVNENARPCKALILFLESVSNIFVPQIRMLAHEVRHHLDAFGVIKNDQFYATLTEEIFRAKKVAVLTDDDARNPVEQGSAGAHDAGAKRTDQGQLVPVAPSSCIANAHRFRVRGWVSALHTQVMAARNNVSATVGEHRSDGQPSFTQSGPGFQDRFPQ